MFWYSSSGLHSPFSSSTTINPHPYIHSSVSYVVRTRHVDGFVPTAFVTGLRSPPLVSVTVYNVLVLLKVRMRKRIIL